VRPPTPQSYSQSAAVMMRSLVEAPPRQIDQ
jgi:hypothetical protein